MGHEYVGVNPITQIRGENDRVKGKPNPLGTLLRKRRRKAKVGFKQLHEATGLEPETLRKWEVGETYDVPLRGVLLYAREVGITLEEIVEAALGPAANRRAAAEVDPDVAAAEADLRDLDEADPGAEEQEPPAA